MPASAEAPDRSLFFRWVQENRHRLNDFAARYSRIPNDPVLDPDQFDWAGEIATNWEIIRDEALGVYAHLDAIPPLRQISADHRGIIKDDSWRSFFLVGYKNDVPENIARAPQTAELVRKIPALNSAFFSILAPGTRISRHRGPSKAYFTAHLGLQIPRDSRNCIMQVEDRDLQWREGEWTIFDDTYEHEVWNDTDEPRIILLCQVGRPFDAPGRWLAEFFDWYLRRSAFVTEAKRELTTWEEAYRKAEAADQAGANLPSSRTR